MQKVLYFSIWKVVVLTLSRAVNFYFISAKLLLFKVLFTNGLRDILSAIVHGTFLYS